MKPNNYFTIFFTIQLLSFTGNAEQNRRILHQPLFPTESSPPPPILSPPPPPDTDQPFFHELPADPKEQGQQSPQTPANNLSTPNQTPTQQSKPVAKFAIAISATVIILGVFSALGFFIYKRCLKRSDESQKLVNGNSQRTGADSRMPPASTFLYIGTVEPTTRSMVSEDSNNVNGSPYRKLNSGKRSDRYRPSPELQPLPPLRKPIPPPIINSPPPMSSSEDDESNGTGFYTPHGSSKSNESTSSSRLSLSNSNPNPHSKRTSRKSRATVPFSPDIKPVMIPAIKQAPPPSPPPPPIRPKFSAPPPPPDMARLRLISSYNKTPPHPPPPPPLPVAAAPSVLGKAGSVEINNPLFVSNTFQRTQAKSCSPTWAKKTPKIEKASSLSEGTKKVESSLERTDSREHDGSKPRLKPLHWDKVRATSERATVWDQLKSSSFQVNEDAIESLFGCNSVNSVPKEGTRKSMMPSLEKENRVLDPKKSQNIAILLRALNVTTEEVTEALLDGNPEGLGPELLETLVKMAPTKEEEIKLKDYNGDITKLGSAERFLKAILDNIPFAFKRVEAMLYRANFDTEVKYLRKSFQTLEEASEELKNSRLFLKLLEAVLRTGNRMNDGTNRGDARAFKLDTLLKLVDVKGTDGKTTLLHFVVQEIIRSEGVVSSPASENKTYIKSKEEKFKKQGLQVVLGLSKEIGNVKNAAGMDSDVLSSYVSKLEMGLEKVKSVLQYEKNSKFFISMKEFLTEAVEEISRVKAEERKALSLVKDATQYFHGDAVKEEAHPFRIFMIVRDFLSVLDNVCKDVGRMQDRATVGTGRAFRIPASASLPVLNRYNVRNDSSSEGDST